MVYDLINASKPSEIAIQVATQVNVLIPSILAFVWIVTGLGSYLIRYKNKGFGNLPLSLTIGGIITSVSGFLFLLVDSPQPLINPNILITYVVLTIVCGIWAFVSFEDR